MKKHFDKIWIRVLLYLGVTGAILFFICPGCFLAPANYVSTIGYTFVLTLLLFEGNANINTWIGKKVSWVKRPILRTVLGVGVTVLFTGSIVVLMYLLVFIWGAGYEFKDYQSSLFRTLAIAMMITLLVSLVLHSREFLFHWREAALRVEKLKNEQMNSRFASLKAQLNPHFLFNSLNALTALVYKDADQAAAFIKKLSEVYRYILEYADEDVVPLEKEMKCLQSYNYLLQIRHGDHLKIKVDIEDDGYFIPPLSLQMLLENATKHNIISQKKPLTIEVSIDKENMLVVSNNYQPKAQSGYSLGKGLTNIKARYGLLTEREVKILQNKEVFEVRLPLLIFEQEKLAPSPY